MQPSGDIKLVSSSSGAVKHKARKVSAERDFPQLRPSAMMHTIHSSADHSMDAFPDQENGTELFEHEVGMVAVLKRDKLVIEEVKARVDSNHLECVQLGAENTLGLDDTANEYCEYQTLTIRLYPSPKRRNVPVVRDFPRALKKSCKLGIQSGNDTDDDVQSEESVMNDDKLGLINDLEVKSDGLEASVARDAENTLGLDDAANEYCEYQPLRIRLYPSPKRRNVPVVRDFPKALKKTCELGIQSGNDTDDYVQSEESVMNDDKLGLINDLEVKSDGLEASVAHDQGETVKHDGTNLTSWGSSSSCYCHIRRVSAVRCFPPGCGRDAVCLSEEELEKAIAESKNHCLSCNCTDQAKPFLEEEIVQVDDGDVVVEEKEVEAEIVHDDDDDVVVEEKEVEEEVVQEDEEEEEWEEVEVEDGDEEGDEVWEEVEVEVEDEDEVIVEEEDEEGDEVEGEEVEVVDEDEEGDEVSVEEKEMVNKQEEWDEVVVEEEEGEEVDEEKEEKVDESTKTDYDKGETREGKVEGPRMVVLALMAPTRPSSQNARAKPTVKRKSFVEDKMMVREEKEGNEVLEEEDLASASRSPTQNSRAKPKAKRKLFKEEIATTPRMVVLGLMASTQCIWRNNARKKARY